MIKIKSSTGYEKVFSKRLQKNIYFIKHRAIKVPDTSLAKYLPKEIALIGTVDDEELNLIQDAKELFGGMLIK